MNSENQNKNLEATVAERTQELSKKHEELNKEHQMSQNRSTMLKLSKWTTSKRPSS